MQGDPLHLVGSTVGGRYDVSHYVAVHGSRVVYRAEHRSFGTPVRLEVVAAGDQQRRAFVGAGGTVAALCSQHAAIAQVRDGGMHEGPAGPVAFVASEWIEGASLADAVVASGKSRFDTETVLQWMDPALDAMVAAHRKGVVHGHFDLNAFFVVGTLGPRATLKVDGLVEGAWRPQLQGGAVPMRPPAAGFSAPELGSGDTTLVGPWTDVYGLAAVLSVLLCGSSSSAMRQRALPSGVQFAFDKALSQRIDARFKTLAAFRASMMDGLPEFGEETNRPVPRRTMVVADPESRLAEGSAGGFEVSDDDDLDVHEPTMAKARVRLAYTQPAMDIPESLKHLDPRGGAIKTSPPTGPHRAASREKGSSNFIVVLAILLVVAVGGGMAVGYLLFT